MVGLIPKKLQPLIIILGVMAAILVGRYLTAGVSHPVPPGPDVEWPRIYATAHDAIAKRDNDAALGNISVYAANVEATKSYSITDALRLSIDFVGSGPGNPATTVELFDTDPAGTLRLEAGIGGTNVVRKPDFRREREQALAAVKVGPREAIRKVWPGAQEVAAARGIVITPIGSLQLSRDGAVWSIQALDAAEWSEMLKLNGEGRIAVHAQYTVDATTGNVLSTNTEEWAPGEK